MAFDVEQLLLRLDDGTAIAGIMRRRFVQAVRLAYGDAADTLEMDLAFDLDNPLIQEVLDELATEIRRVADTTRDEIRALVGKMAEEGWSVEELARRIRETGATNSRSRSRTIAATESAAAYSKGSIAAYQASGVVEGLEWLTFDACSVCIVNEGVIVGLEQQFPSGHMYPPAHPNCRCSLAPVI